MSEHAFLTRPHRTILAFSLPTFFSLVAEPLVGLVDTAFVAQLGVAELAALGVGVTALSSLFWIFNFLGIGTQTEVAQALGQGATTRARRVTSLALLLSMLFGLLIIAGMWPLLSPVSRLLGASGDVEAAAVLYMQVRLFGAPAVLLTLTAFGALRGEQEMRIPLGIALLVNLLNLALDPLLIFGYGSVPALGIAGAAWASTASQWVGALLATGIVLRRLGWTRDLRVQEAVQLLQVGRDLFLRTGLLNLFLILTTRWANQMGAEGGAAHQAIRQVWLFAALGLDALALSAQSLVGYFVGARAVGEARRAAKLSSGWAVGGGVLLALLMWGMAGLVMQWLVPGSAQSLFLPAWLVTAAFQPIMALSFVTDGIHWGTGDYRYLRNAMFLATLVGTLGLLLVDPAQPNALLGIWIVVGVWNLVRAGLGFLRIWPGIGHSPLSPDRHLGDPSHAAQEG